RGVERRHDATELGEVGVGFRAIGEMLADGIHLLVGQGAQDVRGGEVADLVAGQPSGLAAWPACIGHGDSISRIASRPSRIRLFTVPSGVPVRSAISVCVSPPK